MAVVTPTDTKNAASELDSIILPPPTASSPCPSLGLALSHDQHAQFSQVLLENSGGNASNNVLVHGTSQKTLPQVLIFPNESIRTVLLRHVLRSADKPSTVVSVDAFPSIQNNNSYRVVATHVLQSKTKKNGNEDETAKNQAFPPHQMLTYILRSDPHQANAVLQHLTLQQEKMPKDSPIHARLLIFPQISALVRQLLQQGLRHLPKPHLVTIPGLATDAGSHIGSLPPPQSPLSSLDIFPLEPDVLSWEYPMVLTEAVVDQMPGGLVGFLAQSLAKLPDIMGPLRRIQAVGAAGHRKHSLAHAVLEKMRDLQLDDENNNNNNQHQSNDLLDDAPAALILVDRQVDMVTPLVTPLTYQALLHEVFEMDVGYLHVPQELINPPEESSANKTKKNSSKNNATDEATARVALAVHTSPTTTSTAGRAKATNNDAGLFAQVRDQHVEHFGAFLQNQAKVLQASHAALKDSKKKDLREIHQFVRTIPALQQNLAALTHHIHLAERVKKYSETPQVRQAWQTERSCIEGDPILHVIDEWIATQVNVWDVLKLVCLQSLVAAGGIKAGRYDTLRRDIVQTYGYEYLFVLDKLEAAGLVRRREGLWGGDVVVVVNPTPAGGSAAASSSVTTSSSSSWATLRKHLHLVHADVDTNHPDEDISYVSSGYAPLSVRLVQALAKTGIAPAVAAVVHVAEQPAPSSAPPGRTPLIAAARNQRASSKKPLLLVAYLGGITYLEIAALRSLSKRPNFPFHIIILTTHITNGTQLLQNLTTTERA